MAEGADWLVGDSEDEAFYGDDLTPPPSPPPPSPPPPAQPHPAGDAALAALISLAMPDETPADISHTETISNFTSTNYMAGFSDRNRTISETISSFTPRVAVPMKIPQSDPITTADRTIDSLHDSTFPSPPLAQPLPPLPPPKKVGPKPKPAWKGPSADSMASYSAFPGGMEMPGLILGSPAVHEPLSDASKKGSDVPSSSSLKLRPGERLSSSASKKNSKAVHSTNTESSSSRRLYSDDFQHLPAQMPRSKSHSSTPTESSSSRRPLVPGGWLLASDDLPPSSSIPSRIDTSISDIQHDVAPREISTNKEVFVEIPEYPIIDLGALKKRRRKKEPEPVTQVDVPDVFRVEGDSEDDYVPAGRPKKKPAKKALKGKTKSAQEESSSTTRPSSSKTSKSAKKIHKQVEEAVFKSKEFISGSSDDEMSLGPKHDKPVSRSMLPSEAMTIPSSIATTNLPSEASIPPTEIFSSRVKSYFAYEPVGTTSVLPSAPFSVLPSVPVSDLGSPIIIHPREPAQDVVPMPSSPDDHSKSSSGPGSSDKKKGTKKAARSKALSRKNKPQKPAAVESPAQDEPIEHPPSDDAVLQVSKKLGKRKAAVISSEEEDNIAEEAPRRASNKKRTSALPERKSSSEPQLAPQIVSNQPDKKAPDREPDKENIAPSRPPPAPLHRSKSVPKLVHSIPHKGSITELLRRVSERSDLPLIASTVPPKAAYLAKGTKSAVSRIAPLHPHRKTPPPPPPKPPAPKKSKKMLAMEERIEMELADEVEGWSCMTEGDRTAMIRAKRDAELGYDD